MTVTVLHVCMGNICRSPMAEVLLRTRLAEQPGVVAEQIRHRGAGTYGGHAGEPMNPGSAAALAEWGLRDDEFRATALRADHLDQSTVVLTATADQQRDLASGGQAPVFRLTELADLAGRRPAAGGGAAEFRAWIDALDRLRGDEPATAAVDVPDPYGGPPAEYRQARDLIDAAARAIAAGFAGPGSERTSRSGRSPAA